MSGPALEPPEFVEVAIGSKSQQGCSPAEPAPFWSGVALAAPDRVNEAAGRKVVVPVCGTYSVPIRATIRPIGVLHLRVAGAAPIRPRRIGLGDPEDESGRGEPNEPHAAQHVNDDVGGHFAVDIAPFIPFPHHPARIDFSIEFGGHMSPVRTVEWVPDTLAEPEPR